MEKIKNLLLYFAIYTFGLPKNVGQNKHVKPY